MPNDEPVQALSFQNQSQKNQNNSERRHVPYERAHQEYARRVAANISNTSPKIELRPPFGHPTVLPSKMGHEHGRCEQRKSLNEIMKRSVQPTSQPRQDRHGFVTRTRSPHISALKTCRVRGQNDLGK